MKYRIKENPNSLYPYSIEVKTRIYERIGRRSINYKDWVEVDENGQPQDQKAKKGSFHWFLTLKAARDQIKQWKAKEPKYHKP